MRQYHGVTQYRIPAVAVAKHVCDNCGYGTNRVDNFKRHMLKSHGITYENSNTLHARTNCGYPGCTEKFYKKVDVINHWESAHSVSVDSSQHTFDSKDDFLKWKEKEESLNYV